MKHDPWSLLTYLTLSLVVGRAWAAEPVRPDTGDPEGQFDRLTGVDASNPMPIVRALDPEQARRFPDLPVHPDRPVVRQREAVLPDPPNGLELVDRVVAEQGPGRPIPVQTTPAKVPQRVYSHLRPAPTFVLPIATGM